MKSFWKKSQQLKSRKFLEYSRETAELCKQILEQAVPSCWWCLENWDLRPQTSRAKISKTLFIDELSQQQVTEREIDENSACDTYKIPIDSNNLLC